MPENIRNTVKMDGIARLPIFNIGNDAANLLYMAQDMVDALLKDLERLERRASSACKSGKRPR